MPQTFLTGASRREIEVFHPQAWHLAGIERFHSWSATMQIYWNKRKCLHKKEFSSHRTGLGHQHGRCFIVLGHQYGRRDVMWKHSIVELVSFHPGTRTTAATTKPTTTTPAPAPCGKQGFATQSDWPSPPYCTCWCHWRSRGSFFRWTRSWQPSCCCWRR